jgi:hypothetical protein
MRGQQNKVDRPDPSLALKVNSAIVHVIKNVRGQKNGGARERQQHARQVRRDQAATDHRYPPARNVALHPFRTPLSGGKNK